MTLELNHTPLTFSANQFGDLVLDDKSVNRDLTGFVKVGALSPIAAHYVQSTFVKLNGVHIDPDFSEKDEVQLAKEAFIEKSYASYADVYRHAIKLKGTLSIELRLCIILGFIETVYGLKEVSGYKHLYFLSVIYEYSPHLLEIDTTKALYSTLMKHHAILKNQFDINITNMNKLVAHQKRLPKINYFKLFRWRVAAKDKWQVSFKRKLQLKTMKRRRGHYTVYNPYAGVQAIRQARIILAIIIVLARIGSK